MIEDGLLHSHAARLIHNYVDTRITLPLAHKVIAVSKDGFDRLRARIASDKTQLIHNGIDLSRFSLPRSTQPLHDGQSGPVHIGMVGHLRAYKGWRDFISMAAQLKRDGLQTHWHVVGEGPDRKDLEGRVLELGVSNAFSFHGRVADVRPILSQLDIFVLSSHSEGFSVAILEAMAATLPIIATDTGGTREQVEDGVNGYLVGVGNLDALVDRCRMLIQTPSARLAFGAQSRSKVERHFSQEAMFNAYLAVYRDVAAAVVGREARGQL
jgi:glycosyltransferase involved in cell wall biosynthesis